jgi:ATP-binding cassette subfamily C protein LapB
MAEDHVQAEPILEDVPEPVPEPGQAQLGASAKDDPLVQALLWLCKHHGLNTSIHALLNGQALEGALTPEQAVEALGQVGCRASLVKRPPSKILSLLMPVVLLLSNGDACIVLRRIKGQKGRRPTYEVVMPGADDEVCVATEEELLAEYSGFALIAAPKPGARSGVLSSEGGLLRDHWFWGTMRRFVPLYRSSLMAAFISNVLSMVLGLFTSVVYDRVIPTQAFVTLWTLSIGALFAVAFDMAARQLRSYLLDAAGKKSDLALGTMLFRQALGIRMEHRPESAGAFAHRVSQIEVVRDFSASATIATVTDLPFVLLFVLTTWLVAGPLVLVLLVAIPVIIGVALLIQAVLKKSLRANMHQQADLHGVLIEAMEGIEDVRATGAQGYFIQRYEEANAAAAASAMRARSAASWVSNFSAVSQQLITVIMLTWGVHLIAEGKLTGGALMGGIMFAGRAMAPLGGIVNLVSRFQSARAAMQSLDQLMSLPTEREPGRKYLPRPTLKGQLALHEVRFAYPKGTRQHSPLVLKGVNIQINPGERVALLGKIGSGKSTILRLLGGLYQPSEGFVEVDGIDLRQMDPADFRSHVGFVSQEPRLFNGSIKDNVFLGRAAADPEHFLEVARLTGLDRIAAAHPMGYEMPVGEMGHLLSGGQRQLVALARCLVSRPQLLLMDEPTSSMDAQAEVTFIKHLKTALGQQTLVVVTHRPALLDVVDRIIVVDNGRILADGPKALVLAALAGQKPTPTVVRPATDNPDLSVRAPMVAVAGG